MHPLLLASLLDILVKALGVVGGLTVFLLLVVAAIIYFKFTKFKKLALEAAAGQTNPSEIHLNEDLDPAWLEEEDVAGYLKKLAAVGLTKGRAYSISELEDFAICSLWRDGAVVGAFYSHPMTGQHIDLFARFPSGRELTVTNAKMGAEIDHRAEAEKIHLTGDTVQAVLRTYLQKLGSEEAPHPFRSEDEFRAEFEDAYRRDMAWRNARGGISQEEFNRSAALGPHHDLTPAQMQEAFLDSKREEIAQRHEECLDSAIAAGLLSRQDPRFEEGLLLILAEPLHRAAYAEYVSVALGLPELSHQKSEAIASQAASNAEVFERLVQALSPALRPTRVGSVTTPIAAEIWARPS